MCLEKIMQITVIVALVLATIKAYREPLSRLVRAISPFRLSRSIRFVNERMEQVEMQQLDYNSELKAVKKQLSDLKKAKKK